MPSIKLDICYGDLSIGDTLHDLTAGLDITFDATGVSDAGGWPEYEFTGSVVHLVALATRYAGECASPEARRLDPRYANLRDTLDQVAAQLKL